MKIGAANFYKLVQLDDVIFAERYEKKKNTGSIYSRKMFSLSQSFVNTTRGWRTQSEVKRKKEKRDD